MRRLNVLWQLLFMIVVVLAFFSSVAAALMFNRRYKLCDARVQQPFYFGDLHQPNGKKVRKAIFYCMHSVHRWCVHTFFFGRRCCCHALMKLLSFCLVTHINSMFYAIFDHHNFLFSLQPPQQTHTYSQLSHHNV